METIKEITDTRPFGSKWVSRLMITRKYTQGVYRVGSFLPSRSRLREVSVKLLTLRIGTRTEVRLVPTLEAVLLVLLVSKPQDLTVSFWGQQGMRVLLMCLLNWSSIHYPTCSCFLNLLCHGLPSWLTQVCVQTIWWSDPWFSWCTGRLPRPQSCCSSHRGNRAHLSFPESKPWFWYMCAIIATQKKNFFYSRNPTQLPQDILCQIQCCFSRENMTSEKWSSQELKDRLKGFRGRSSLCFMPLERDW